MFRTFGTCRAMAAVAILSVLPACGRPPESAIVLQRRIEEVTREIERHPDDAALLIQRAELYQAVDRWEAMKADLDRVLALRPRDAFAWGLHGNVLMHLGRLDAAIDSFGRSIAEDPLARVYFDRGFAHELQGDLPQAIADYTEAIRLDPELVAAVFARGQVYQQTGDFRNAVKDFASCRKRKPDDLRTTLALSWLLATCPDAAVRDGRQALRLATVLCDPILCSTPETLNALAAAYAELGEFDKAETLLERAVAVSHFAPEFHEASSRRLQLVRGRQPIREATIPLGVLMRPLQDLPRTIGLDEALAAPADVLGAEYLRARTLIAMCTLASAGATINALLDERPLTITAVNASRIQSLLEDRLAVFAKAIRQRGHARLASGYRARATGGCAAWGLDAAPVIVEQDGFDLHLSQENVRHMGVVVESRIAFRHDMNTVIIIDGRIDDGQIVFMTTDRGGISGTADRRCTLTLTPSEIAGADWAKAFVGRALAFQSYEEYGRMLADLERSLELRPDAEVSARRAYLLATCPDAKVRDGSRAIAAAEETRRLAGGTRALMVHAVLAVAHAEAGDFAEAVQHQRQVVDLVTDEEKPHQLDRLRLFESGKPYHERRAFDAEPP